MNLWLLANLDLSAHQESFAKSTKMFANDVSVVFAVGAIFFTAFLLWARYLRNRRRRVSGGEKVVRGITAVAPGQEDEPEEIRRRYKRRVRRRDHRVRNPTLAETGGLPPVRDENRADSP